MRRQLVAPFASLRRLSAWGALLTGALTLLVFRRFTAFTLLAVGVTVGFLLYALLGPHEPETGERLADRIADDPRIPGALTVAFLLATVVSLYSLTWAYYDKPLPYYVGIAAAAGVLAVRVILTDAHRTNLALALVYGSVTFLSNQVAFPLGLNGPDVGDHVGLARNVRETGHVVGGGVYDGFPAQHLLAAGVAEVAGTGTHATYLAVGIAGMLLGLPVTYFVARTVGDERFGVLAVLFYASMEYVVYRAGHPSKLAYALPLLLLTFACAADLYRERHPGTVVLFGLFATALVFTHHHTAFVALIMLGALAAGQAAVPWVIRFAPAVEGTGGATQTAADGGGAPGLRVARGHVLALLFAVAFVAQFLYYSQFFGNFVDIAREYAEIFLVLGEQDAVKETPRFSTIPLTAIFVNTIGSGIMATLAVLGVLDHVRRRVPFSMVVLAWLAVAGPLMVVGVVLNVPFALPNRVYVIVEVTGAGLFGAAGLLYLLRTARAAAPAGGPSAGRAAVVAVALVFVGFAFFSTASTIAGIETSPFNEDVPHRTWYRMAEEEAAAEHLDGAGVPDGQLRWARGFPVSDAGAINYSTAGESTVIGLNGHKIETGVTVQGGTGRIGGGVYVIPTDAREGLEGSDHVYDNGVIDAYARSEKVLAGGDQPNGVSAR